MLGLGYPKFPGWMAGETPTTAKQYFNYTQAVAKSQKHKPADTAKFVAWREAYKKAKKRIAANRSAAAYHRKKFVSGVVSKPRHVRTIIYPRAKRRPRRRTTTILLPVHAASRTKGQRNKQRRARQKARRIVGLAL